jgi:two-component system response regulator ChvI
MKRRIALIDDDKNILASVSMALEAEGFDVEIFGDAEKGVEKVLSDPVDLVVLDIKMPRMDGMEALKAIRAKSAMPVVFLTSRDDEIDQFLGLRSGADDYITKPFSQRLLVERIRVVLRRHDMRADMTETPQKSGLLTLDDDRQICRWKGKTLDLTVTEFLMVKSLAQNPGHVKSREQLMNAAYGASVYVDDRTVDSHIKRIRRKFRDADAEFDGIETVYGAGYKLKDA